jgi:hypothetical protein
MSGPWGAKHGRFLEVPLDWAKCGSEANYAGHLRRGEKPCAACKKAMNRARRERYSPEAQAASRRRRRRRVA